MKVNEPKSPPVQAEPSNKKKFAGLLSQQKKPVGPPSSRLGLNHLGPTSKKQVVVGVSVKLQHSPVQSAARLVTRREHMHAEAARLVDCRQESHQTQDERFSERVRDLIRHDLEQMKPSLDGTKQMPPPSSSSNSSAQGGSHQDSPQTGNKEPGNTSQLHEKRASRAMALVHQIEVFSRKGAPTLSLTMDASVGGTIELEKTGKQVVAITLKGANGLRDPESIKNIRETLENKGIRISELRIQ